MLAVIQTQTGGPETLQINDVPCPTRHSGQLLVKVMAAGVNRADIAQRQGNYPPPEGASPILGLEASGIITECDISSRFQPGDSVMGLVEGGAYAEYVIMEEALAIPKPDWLSWIAAASLPEAWMTAWFNLVEKARIQAGENVLIHAGASGVGAAAIQLTKLLGANPIASAGSEEKLSFCQRFGASHHFNYKECPQFAEQIKAWGGADIILDPVGASFLSENLRSLNADGRLIHIGLLGGNSSMLNIGQVLMKRLSLIGSTLRPQPLAIKALLTQALEDKILPAIQAGKAHVTIDSSFPVSQVQEAHEYIEANRNLGKILLTTFTFSTTDMSH